MIIFQKVCHLRIQHSFMNRQYMEKKIFRFFWIGAFNTALGFALFPIIYYVFFSYRHHYILMLIICQLICILNSYLTNKYFVFKTKGNFSREVPKFILFHIFYFFIISVVIPFFVESWKINPVLMQLCISTMIVLTSYFWYDRFAFLKDRR